MMQRNHGERSERNGGRDDDCCNEMREGPTQNKLTRQSYVASMKPPLDPIEWPATAIGLCGILLVVQGLDEGLPVSSSLPWGG